jgi:Thioredoxin
VGEDERSAGSEHLLISLPALAVAVGILGASWARTERIDAMESTFLRHTVGKKLETYLVAPKSGQDRAGLYPPLFKRIERFSPSKLVKVDVDAAPQLSQRFGVRAVPTLLLLNQGQLITRQAGAAPVTALRTWLDQALAHHIAEATS